MKTQPNPPTGNSDEPCGHLYLDGKYLGFFWSCDKAEKVLEALTGYQVKLPRSKPGSFAWVRTSDVLRLEVLQPLRTRLPRCWAS